MNHEQLVLCPVSVNDLVKAISQNVVDTLTPLLYPATEKPTLDPELYITRKETAEMLRVTLPTLHKYTVAGLIPAYRMGRKIRFKRHEVQQALTKIKTVKS